MNILSLLGINVTTKTFTGTVELAYQEYFSRFVRIKNLIEANPAILANLNNAFCSEYLNSKLKKSIIYLGQGETHNVYSICSNCIQDDDNDISLALRLKKIDYEDNRFYKIKDARGGANFQLFSELNTFCEAFAENRNPPYFSGLVEWRGPGRFEEGVVGIITEDVTKRKTLKSSIRQDFLTDYMQITGLDGKVNSFFIDIVAPRGYNPQVLKYGIIPIKVDYK